MFISVYFDPYADKDLMDIVKNRGSMRANLYFIKCCDKSLSMKEGIPEDCFTKRDDEKGKLIKRRLPVKPAFWDGVLCFWNKIPWGSKSYFFIAHVRNGHRIYCVEGYDYSDIYDSGSEDGCHSKKIHYEVEESHEFNSCSLEGARKQRGFLDDDTDDGDGF